MPCRVNTPVCSATSCGVPAWIRPPTPAYSPSEFSRTQTMSMSAAPRFASGERDPGQQPHRPQVDVLIEALAERQDQLPHGDVSGTDGCADRAEVDRVERREPLEAVVVHHAAVRRGSSRSPTGTP